MSFKKFFSSAQTSKEINWLVAMSSLDGLAGGLLGIFLPVYFLSLGYNLYQVISYFIWYSVFVFVFFLLAGYAANHWGLRVVIFLRVPLLFVYLALLYLLKDKAVYLPVIAIIHSCQIAFFWFSVHFLFSKLSPAEKMGKNLGKFLAWPKVVRLFSPLIGGFIIIRSGFQFLFVLAFVVYFFSVVPVFFLSKFKTKVNLNWRRLCDLFTRYPRYFFAEIWENVGEEVGGIIFPLFVFLVMKNFITIGWLGTLAGLGAAIFTYIVGHLADKTPKPKILLIGSLSLGALWLGRYFWPTPWFFYSSSLIFGFLMALILVPFGSIIYSLAKKDTAEEFIIFREIPVLLGRLFVYFSALIFISHLEIIFLLTALSLIPFYFISRKIVI